MKVLNKTRGLSKSVYRVQLEGDERFLNDDVIALMLGEWLGINYRVTRFEDIAEITVYED